MIFRQILFHILTILNNERTVSSAFHLLKGKRSGQTIQDVGIYKLHSYFGILPKLNRDVFNHEITELGQQGYINVQEDGFYTINETQKLENPTYFFNGWRYRGNEHIFFSRLSLLVETLSHVKNDIRYFAPTEKDQETMHFIRRFLSGQPFQTETFREKVLQELMTCLSSEQIEEVQRDLIVNRLTGYNIAGSTWKQLESKHQLANMDVYLLFISGLHLLLDEILKRDMPILKMLAHNVEVTIPLTDSTKITANYITQGYSIEQIAQMRNLKTSTIEDHVVEMAMNIPSFSITPFMQELDLKKIIDTSEDYATKKLRVLKEVLPEYSYFQLRLALAKGV